MDPELERVVRRLFDVAANPDELATIILKGHLLVEEQLNRALGLAFEKPSFLNEARISFSQRVAIARAIEDGDDPVWEVVLEINRLRNDLAHSLELKGRPARIANLRRLLLRPSNPPDVLAQAVEASDKVVVGLAVGVCLGVLASWENTLREHREGD